VVQHAAPEGPYRLATALAEAGVGTEVRHVYKGEAVPAGTAGYGGVVVMGGPMSAASDTGFPSRRAELALLAQALAGRVPVLGVCLGAQLLALAAGGTVYEGASGPEIGWGAVALAPEALPDLLLGGLPPTLDVMHWHGDTFDLPPGAVHLASSARYHNQAFRAGGQAWGFQFHLEVDAPAVDAFLAGFGAEALAAGRRPEEIAHAAPAVLARLAPVRDVVLGRFASLVAARS
jgi:GMP synthase-like glutamine amidotransferase